MMYQEGSTPTGGQTQLPESFKAEKLDSLKSTISTILTESVKLQDTWATLDGLSASFTRNLNGSRERIVVMETAILGAAQSVMELSSGVISFEDALVSSTKILAEIQEATRTTLIGNEENIRQIYTTTQATGIASKDLISSFKQQGAALSSIPKTMQKVVDYTRSIGMNVKAVSSDVIKNLDKLNLYNFNNGVEGLTKMVAKAQLLSVPMEKVLKIADDVFDPEKAVNLSASLQRLGVATGDLLDPLRLMDLGQNNPEELTNQIVEMSKRFTYFNEENQKFEILPGAKRELREIAETIGMSSSELATMALQSSTLSDKMSKIRFPRLETGPISKEQEMLIANLSELQTEGKFKGQYTVKVEQVDAQGQRTGETVEKSVAELTPEDIKILGQSAQPKELEDIAKDQLSAMNRVANNTAVMASQGKKSVFASKTGQETRRDIYQESTITADAVLRAFEKTIAPKMNDGTEDVLKTFKTNLMRTLSSIETVATTGDFSGFASGLNIDMSTEMTNLRNTVSRAGDVIGDFGTTIEAEKQKIKEKKREALEGVQNAQNTGTYYEAIDNLRRNNTTEPNQNLIESLEEEETPQSNQTGGGPGAYNVNVSSPIPNVNVSPNMANMSGEIKHQFNDLNIIVKIDAQPGVDTAQITDVVVKTLNRPEVIQSIMAKQTLMTQNYGTTGGKVGTSQSTA
jgi:hypothetical protein